MLKFKEPVGKYRLRADEGLSESCLPIGLTSSTAAGTQDGCFLFRESVVSSTGAQACRFLLARIVYLALFGLLLERSAPQPVSPQMFHARGECKGGRLDSGRGGVLQATSAEMCVGPLSTACRRVRLRGPPLRLFFHLYIVCFVIFKSFSNLF